ncbi:MAG: hemolysin family protein [Christensenellales bacterium]
MLVFVSGYFSASETAFSSMNQLRLKTMVGNGNKGARRALALIQDYDKVISTILIGNTIVNIAAASLATVLFAQLITRNAITWSTIFMIVIILIFGEIIPKSIAQARPERFAIRSTPILRVLLIAATPLNFLLTGIKKMVLRLFRDKEESVYIEDELKTMVDEVEQEGGIDAQESELIHAAIEFRDLSASDILTPRVDIVAVEDIEDMETVVNTFRDSGYSRLPVYRESVDHIIGVVLQKDFFARDVENTSLKDYIKELPFVVESTPISVLMRQLQQTQSHMAVVVDEFGGTAGILTLEDILEELVGEIWDEYDQIEEQYQSDADGSYIVPGNADLDDVLALFSLEPTDEAEDISTVNGWILNETGRIPAPGEILRMEGLDVSILDADQTHINLVRIAKELETEADEQDA